MFRYSIILLLFPICHTLIVHFGPFILQYNDPGNCAYVKFYFRSSLRPEMQPTLFDCKKPMLPKWAALTDDIKIIIHGYNGGIVTNYTKSLERAYLQKKNTSLVIVDWSILSRAPFYPIAVINTKQVGHCVANFLSKLERFNPSFDIGRIHFLGLSLGAHICGFAANEIEQTSGKRIQRITGLDPAYPLFTSSDLNEKLDSTDANFVDIIHTNMWICGQAEPTGHVDFYFNSGIVQPNCEKEATSIFAAWRCSHLMSIEYFAESIASEKGFWGVHCTHYLQVLFGTCENQATKLSLTNKALMGEYSSNVSSGIFHITTNTHQPFALGRNGALKATTKKPSTKSKLIASLDSKS